MYTTIAVLLLDEGRGGKGLPQQFCGDLLLEEDKGLQKTCSYVVGGGQRFTNNLVYSFVVRRGQGFAHNLGLGLKGWVKAGRTLPGWREEWRGGA